MQEMKQIRVIDKCLIKVIVSLHLAFTYSLAMGMLTIHMHYDMSHKDIEQCFHNYKIAVLESAEHPDDPDYEMRESQAESELEVALEEKIRTQILRHIESYLRIELTL